MELEQPNHAPTGHRTLAAIVFSDVVNFSGKMSVAEEHTLYLVHRDLDVMMKLCQQFQGRVLKGTGDGLLMYFNSAVQAVACSLEIQKVLAEQAATLPPKEVLQHRIGIHLGDVFVSETDVMGDGVNIAARLQAEADPGGICISQIVYDVVKKRLEMQATYLGARELKHIQELVPIYQIVLAAQSVNTERPNGLEPSSPTIEGSIHPRPFTVNPDQKQSLERVLTEVIGPIAPIVVQKTLKQSSHASEMVEKLVAQLPADQQVALRPTLTQILVTSAQPHPERSGESGLPMERSLQPPNPHPTQVSPDSNSQAVAEIDPEFIQQCERELTKEVGPIANALIKRILAKQTLQSRSDLVEALSQHLTNPQTAQAFRDRLTSP